MVAAAGAGQLPPLLTPLLPLLPSHLHQEDLLRPLAVGCRPRAAEDKQLGDRAVCCRAGGEDPGANSIGDLPRAKQRLG